MDSNIDLDKKAAEELLLEAKRAAERASIGGALAWQKCPLAPTNKHFLRNTVRSVLFTNKLKERKWQESKLKMQNKKRTRSPVRNSDRPYNSSKNHKHESKTLENIKHLEHKYAENRKEDKSELKVTKNKDVKRKEHKR